MQNLLYLAHRLPYPPNKGDKLRSFHLLCHLSKSYRIFLGTFVDATEDLDYIESLRPWCAEICVIRLVPPLAMLRSLLAFATQEPLTIAYYRKRQLHRWLARTVHQHAIDSCVVFCSAMAQYAFEIPGVRRVLIDFVDVDSVKWMQYAKRHSWPLSWLYRREATYLLAYERKTALTADRAFFVTEAETALFCSLAPECADRCETIGNGVDAEYFSPEHDFASPFPPGVFSIVFTGAMDYWPNGDAVCWFASEILPVIRNSRPDVRFTIVGMRPGPDVRGLAGDYVTVTGKVPDVRPYLRHADVVVAPLRVARGVQNKILEAMAMARPVVASIEGATGIEAESGRDYVVAGDAATFIIRILELIAAPSLRFDIGNNARRSVLKNYSWSARLGRVDRWLGSSACNLLADGRP